MSDRVSILAMQKKIRDSVSADDLKEMSLSEKVEWYKILSADYIVKEDVRVPVTAVLTRK